MERDNKGEMKDNRNLGIIKAMVWEPSAVETFWNLWVTLVGTPNNEGYRI